MKLINKKSLTIVVALIVIGLIAIWANRKATPVVVEETVAVTESEQLPQITTLAEINVNGKKITQEEIKAMDLVELNDALKISNSLDNALALIRAEYNRKYEESIECVLDKNTLATDQSMQSCSDSLSAIKQIIAATKLSINTAISKHNQELEKLGSSFTLDNKRREILEAIIHESRSENLQRLNLYDDMFAINEQMALTYNNILGLLKQSKGTWSFSEGMPTFKRKKDLTSYNKLINKLGELTLQLDDIG